MVRLSPYRSCSCLAEFTIDHEEREAHDAHEGQECLLFASLASFVLLRDCFVTAYNVRFGYAANSTGTR
jgi:hypothetical protein